MFYEWRGELQRSDFSKVLNRHSLSLPNGDESGLLQAPDRLSKGIAIGIVLLGQLALRRQARVSRPLLAENTRQ